MYAIIKTGGKQYRASVGDVIEVELLPGEAGGEVTFEDVLLVSSDEGYQVGKPVVEQARVKGQIVDQFRAPKVTTFKFKRRKNQRRTIGHRQDLTRVKITEISAG
jgi:large subunit ribosomal protein L21